MNRLVFFLLLLLLATAVGVLLLRDADIDNGVVVVETTGIDPAGDFERWASTQTTTTTTTTVKPRRVRPAARTTPPPPSLQGDVWTRLVACEAGGNWHINNPPHQGGPQFHWKTWDAYKPAGFPEEAWQATPAQQIVVAERVLAAQGWRAWPTCSRKLGLR